MSASERRPFVVAAIDFGTTYSGWAYSFVTDPCKIVTPQWTGSQLTSPKSPTCVLIQPDGLTLDTFGFKAETRYSQLCADGDHKRWYYFQRFKMLLWNKSIHKDIMLEDECGKPLLALTVFSLAIRYLKDSLIQRAKQEIAGLDIDDIKWVITVPAIWDDRATHFMRLAAQEKATMPLMSEVNLLIYYPYISIGVIFPIKYGDVLDSNSVLKAEIAEEKLTVALEPDAAAIYCRHIEVQKGVNSDISCFRPGQKFIILDAGGGTIDTTVYEVSLGGGLKANSKATGGAWGGTMVDEAFVHYFAELFGSDTLSQLKKQHMEDYIELMRNFELKKRETDLKSAGRVTIRLPVAISNVVYELKGQSLEHLIQASPLASKMDLFGEKLRLDNEIYQSFFRGSVDRILHHVSYLLRQPGNSGLDTILMVGGYSESPLLRKAVQNEFPTMRIIVPQYSGLSVLMGAVLYGHAPTVIKERIAKYTYGMETCYDFDKVEHPLEKRILFEQNYCCVNIFHILVRSGEALIVGEFKAVGDFFPVNVNQAFMSFNLFRSTNKDVRFVTDIGCQQIGSIKVSLPGKGLNRPVAVRIMFGGTEIMIEFVDKSTGKKTKTLVDIFL